MKNEDNFLWGARIERGEVTAAHDDANVAYRYDVKSIDRPGVNVYGLAAISGQYTSGALVYFFTFEDGKGMILCGIV